MTYVERVTALSAKDALAILRALINKDYIEVRDRALDIVADANFLAAETGAKG